MGFTLLVAFLTPPEGGRKSGPSSDYGFLPSVSPLEGGGVLSKFFLSWFFRCRRWYKALRNWRRFGVLTFGSLLIAAPIFAPLSVSAQVNRLHYLRVSPASAEVEAGQTQSFTVTAYNETGSPILDGSVSFIWSVRASQSAAGTINQSGLFTAGVTPGDYPSAIKVEGHQSSTGIATAVYVSVKILPASGGGGGEANTARLNYITLNQRSISLHPQESFQFVVKAFDELGREIVSGVNFTWSMRLPQAGSITQSGLLTAGTLPGSYSNAVRVEARQGSTGIATAVYASVTITPIRALALVVVSPATVSLGSGESQQFSARGYDQNNLEITNLIFSWTKSGGGSLDGSGLYTAPASIPAAATAIITATATYQGVTQSGSARVYLQPDQVVQPTLDRVVISPNYAVVLENDSLQLAVTAYDQFGNPLTSNLTVIWQVAAGAGSITGGGLYTAPSVSETAYEYIGVTVSRNGVTKTAQAVIEVRNRAAEISLSQIIINPIISALPVGSSVQFTAVAYDTNGDVIPGLVFAWSRSGLGNIDAQTGFFSAGSAPGSVTVRAETTFKNQIYQAILSFQIVDPNQPFLAYLTITPQALALAPGAVQVFTASAFDQFGSPLTPGSWGWSLGPGSSGTLQGSGFQATYTAGASGTALIIVSATSNNLTRSAQASVVIQTAGGGNLLAGVTLTPYLLSLQPNQSGNIVATATPVAGETIDQNQVIFSWSLLDSSIGTLNPTLGRTTTFTADGVTGDFSGVIRVTATLGNETAEAFASVVINPIEGQGVLAAVVLIPERTSMPTNTYQQLTARPLDSFGNLVTGVSFSWQILAGSGMISGSGAVVQLLSGGIAQPLTVRVTAIKDAVVVSDTKVIDIFAQIIDGLLNSVVISPDPATLNLGQPFQFAATAYDVSGQVLSGVTFIWEVINSAAGSINQNGLFTAGNTTGAFSDAVKVTAIKDGITRYDFATLVIQSGAPSLGSLIGSSLVAELESPTATTNSIIRYDLTVRNSGHAPLTNVRAVFLIPTYTRLSSALSAWSNLLVIDRQVIWLPGNLVPGESKTATIRVFINGLPSRAVRILGRAELTATERPEILTVYSNEIEARRASIPAGPVGAGPVYGPGGLIETGLPILAIILSAVLALAATLWTRRRLKTQALITLPGEDDDELVLEL